MCIPLANEGVGLGPSSSGPVASHPPLTDRSASAASMILFTWAFHALVFHSWWLASGTSGSRTSWYVLLVYDQGASDSLPHPSPGREVEASVFGVAVRVLLQATSLPNCMDGSRRRARICPSLPFKDCNSVLKVFLF